MKLTAEILKEIIKEELENVIGEADFPSPFNDGKRDAESGMDFNKNKYPDMMMQKQYAAGYLEAKAGEAAEPEMEPMPDPMPGQDEYEARSAGGVSAVAPGRGANPAQKSINKARTKIRMRRR